ncbi:hypothetical protein M404DRAFT_996544 [Pisolithus tinctorius Marx 270]|uniref:Uncharacterized protein n=1 Tax=Pisolithus tinctorius Marx 270 TaxID=870435 RepID=A0A0C3P8B0_PISTI|nr:hypothetical protein M404DRAFT_996544 [Pisolithus tinctorius Marx 270]
MTCSDFNILVSRLEPAVVLKSLSLRCSPLPPSCLFRGSVISSFHCCTTSGVVFNVAPSNVPWMVGRTQVTASDAVYHVSQVGYTLAYPIFAICLRKVVKMGTSGNDSGQQPWDHIRAEAVGTQPKRRLCLQLTDKHNLLVLNYRGACGIQHWILWTCFVPFGFVRPSGHPVTAKPSDVRSLYRVSL